MWLAIYIVARHSKMPPKLQRQFSEQHIALAQRIKAGIGKSYNGDVAVIIGINYWGTSLIYYLHNDRVLELPYKQRSVPSEEVVAHNLPNVLVVSIVNKECTSSCALSDGQQILDRKMYNVVREVLV